MEIFKTIVLLRWTSPLPSRQEFLTLRPAVSMSSQPLARDLQWMVNFEIEGAWQYVPVKRVGRGLIPRDMYVAGFSFCWQITSSEGESLIRSAVREGTWIALNLPSATDVDTLRSPQGFAAREQAHRELFSPQSSLFPNPQAVPKPGKGLS